MTRKVGQRLDKRTRAARIYQETFSHLVSARGGVEKMRPEQVILASQIAEAHALRRRSWETYFATPDLAPEQATALRSEWSTQADTVRHGIGAMRALDPDGGLPTFDPVDALERARKRALDAERAAQTPAPALLPAPTNSQ